MYLPDFSVDPEVIELLARRRPARPTAPEVLARALEGLAEEIRIMLDEGVVAAPEDIDLCMILGAGWPFHLGGITPYLDRTGIAAKVNGAAVPRVAVLPGPPDRHATACPAEDFLGGRGPWFACQRAAESRSEIR